MPEFRVIERCHQRRFEHPDGVGRGGLWVEQRTAKIVKVKGIYNGKKVNGWFYMVGWDLQSHVDFCCFCGKKLV